MMKKTLILILFFCSTSVNANDITVSYQKLNKELSISGKMCTYGKKSKRSLPESVIRHIHKHVKNYNNDFIQQIRDIKTGMFGRRLNTAELAVIYQLNDQQLEMDYFFEGNNACVNYLTVLALDFNTDSTAYFSFEQPASWTFLAKRNNLTEINQAIKSIYPDIMLTAQDLNQVYLVELSQVSDSYVLYKLNAASYLAEQKSQLNTVFITAPKPYKSAISAYLTDYKFSVVEVQDSANWSLSVDPVKSDQGLLFTVHYQSKNGSNKLINNDPDSLPPIVTTNDQELKNLIMLHLEMMEFVELLKSP